MRPVAAVARVWCCRCCDWRDRSSACRRLFLSSACSKLFQHCLASSVLLKAPADGKVTWWHCFKMWKKDEKGAGSVLHQVFSLQFWVNIWDIYIYMYVIYIYTHGLHRFHMDLAHGENPSATALPADAFSKRSADFSVCRSRSASMDASCRSLGSWGSKSVKRRVMVIRFFENINVYRFIVSFVWYSWWYYSWYFCCCSCWFY